MTPIKAVPELDWSDIAMEEILSEDANGLIAASEVACCIKNIVIAGLIYSSYLQPPWFWFALAKGVTIRDLLDFRRLKEHIPQGALTAVNVKHKDALRFAELYGFRSTGKLETHKGKTYKIFRRT